MPSVIVLLIDRAYRVNEQDPVQIMVIAAGSCRLVFLHAETLSWNAINVHKFALWTTFR